MTTPEFIQGMEKLDELLRLLVENAKRQGRAEQGGVHPTSLVVWKSQVWTQHHLSNVKTFICDKLDEFYRIGVQDGEKKK